MGLGQLRKALDENLTDLAFSNLAAIQQNVAVFAQVLADLRQLFGVVVEVVVIQYTRTERDGSGRAVRDEINCRVLVWFGLVWFGLVCA